MAFVALEVATELIGGLGEVVPRIETRDRSLADQIRRAASSIALNIAEGGERSGRDRKHCFRIASGSAEEVRAALGVAAAWGYTTTKALEPSYERLHRLRGLLYGLVKR